MDRRSRRARDGETVTCLGRVHSLPTLMGLFGGGNAGAAAAAEAAAAAAGGRRGIIGGLMEAVRTMAAKPATNMDWCGPRV